ncbi:hypothetical protein GGI35DRAFT_444043 [Trichoderma velutinum]
MKASLTLLVATCASSALAKSLGDINPEVDARNVITGDFQRAEAYPVEPYPYGDAYDDEIVIPGPGFGKGKDDGKGKGKGKDDGKGKGKGKDDGKGKGKGKDDGKGKGKDDGKGKGKGKDDGKGKGKGKDDGKGKGKGKHDGKGKWGGKGYWI